MLSSLVILSSVALFGPAWTESLAPAGVFTTDLVQAQCGISQTFPNHRRPRNPDSSPLSSASAFFHLDNFASRARIIGGEQVEEKAWPWQVSIKLRLSRLGEVGHWCGGTLIHPRWILTAAHCIQNSGLSGYGSRTWSAVLSDHDRSLGGDDGELVVPVQGIFTHQQFQEYHHDIAMVHLPEDRRILALSPVCLPITRETLEPEAFLGLRCISTGWGQTVFGGKLAQKLRQNPPGSHLLGQYSTWCQPSKVGRRLEEQYQEYLSKLLFPVELTIVNNSFCGEVYSQEYNIPIKRYHLCAGSRGNKGRGTCVEIHVKGSGDTRLVLTRGIHPDPSAVWPQRTALCKIDTVFIDCWCSYFQLSLEKVLERVLHQMRPKGDSGGPLHCNMRDGRWYLAGITSFGSGCAKLGFPDVFVRVTSYLPWISKIMQENNDYSPR